MEGQSNFPQEEEVIMEGELDVQQAMDAEKEGSEESEVDQLLPQPAFQIEEDHQNLTQEEKDAFTYILSVRNQKEAILKSHPKIEAPHEIVVSSDIQLKHVPHLHQIKTDQLQTLLSDWRAQSVQHWKLVIENIKYIQKTADKEKYIKKKLQPSNILSIVPQAYQLSLNTSLHLPQIQKLLVDISNLYYEHIENRQASQKEDTPKYQFHLWIYSLLALHQSYASYTNFEALASINAVMQREARQFELRSKSKDGKNFSEDNQIIKWLINLVILIDVFNQKFLKKHLSIIQSFGIL